MLTATRARDLDVARVASRAHNRIVRKKLLLVVAVLLVIAVVFAERTIGLENIVGMLRYDQRRGGALKVGDPAPDVLLASLDGTERVHMVATPRTKPLVLVFGSYT